MILSYSENNMRKITKPNRKQKKSNKIKIILFFLLVLSFGLFSIVLPTTQTTKLSYGASVPFTPIPAKPNLQLEWFLVPTGSNTLPGTTTQQPAPINPPPAQQNQQKPNQPGNSFLPPSNSSPVVRITPRPVGPTAPKSNGQLCSVGNNSGQSVTGSCYCADLTVTCKNGVGYGANGGLYPGPNPCGTKVAPRNGRFCVEKPVIYLYPTLPTSISVQVITSGSVVISDPTYPPGGWNNVLAMPDGNLTYKGKNYSELFYETSVTDFQKPQQGVTIAKAQLTEKLSSLLDQLGLIGKEKQEFLSFWLPQLETLPSQYIFFSVLSPSAKAGIDTVAITPKPDTQINFIAYFKAAAQPAKDMLKLPPTPKRLGFVSVEWGGVIDK